MTELFGTDGIRGVAGEYPMTAKIAVKVGQAVAGHFRRRRSRPRVVVGRDTRLSGGMLESALAAGLSSRGADVLLAGVLPTPGVAFLARDLKASAGVVISASHNPYQDNGIKIFGGDGFKLSDDDEAKLEAVILENDEPVELPAGAIGGITVLSDAAPRYADFLASAVP
ncbi:MAG: phosphoglucosamine mutase, partial [Candidatus Aureabacteria bacterium]|nr:phosphoglucosamine mutase [Candidatus Auribacterota bacterium]